MHHDVLELSLGWRIRFAHQCVQNVWSHNFNASKEIKYVQCVKQSRERMMESVDRANCIKSEINLIGGARSGMGTLARGTWLSD